MRIKDIERKQVHVSVLKTIARGANMVLATLQIKSEHVRVNTAHTLILHSVQLAVLEDIITSQTKVNKS